MENLGSGTGIVAAATKGAPEVVKNNGVPPDTSETAAYTNELTPVVSSIAASPEEKGNRQQELHAPDC
jgi:hypothetical protein